MLAGGEKLYSCDELFLIKLGCVYCSGNRTQYATAIDPAEKLRKYLENKRDKKKEKKVLINSRI